jgi:hypothetical protein
MSLSTVTTGQTIAATHVNQLVNVLQKTAGNTEVGKYYLQGGSNSNGWTVSNYIVSLSRGTATVSISIDTADQAPAASANSPSALFLTANGFQIEFTTSAASNTARAAGNWTIQY